MKDWERKLMKKVVEDMREGKQICLRNYSEAMMWYSDEKMLKVSPDTKMYDLSPHAVLFSVDDNLYLQTLEGFDLLGKASQLLIQLEIQKPQTLRTDSEQRSVKAQEIVDKLDWLKSEALKRLNEKIPGLEIDSVDAKVGYEQPDEDNPIDDGDVVLWMDLAIGMIEVSLEQLSALVDICSDIIITDVNTIDSPVTYDIEYHMSYGFDSWNGKLEDSLTRKGEE